jgi:hypothetical protein
MKNVAFLIVSTIILAGCLVSSPGKPTSNTIPPESTATLQPSNTIIPTNTIMPSPTNTPEPTKTPVPSSTPTPDLFAVVGDHIKTYKSEELVHVFNEFSKSKTLVLDNYSYNAARTHTLFPSYTDLQPEEFLVISKVKWSHAPGRITDSAASCGFTFRFNNDDKSYFAVISADGNTRFINADDKYWRGLDHKMILSQSFTATTDEVEFVMAVMPERFVLAIDGEIILDNPMKWDSTGYFGYALISGTNRDYGTRCTFTDTTLFINKMVDNAELPSG